MSGKNKQGDAHRVRPWNIFQNDLPSYAESDNLADDHQIYIYITRDSIKKAAQELKSGTEKVKQWYKLNRLKANPTKYQTIAVGPKSSKKEPADELSLQIDNQVVKSSDNFTILGVTIDDKLTYSEHIKDISKRASQNVGELLRLCNLIPSSAKLQLSKSAILPHLTHCDIVWHFCNPRQAQT